MYDDTSRELFNDDWLFIAPSKTSLEIDPAVIPEDSKTVQLPHAWNSEGWSYGKNDVTEPAPAGTGWYFKMLPAVNNVSLKFEGISAASEIFLNGHKIHEHIGAHRVFDVPLNGARGDGTDLLAVKVIDKPSVPLLAEGDDPFSKSPRYQRWALPMGSSMHAGGIWRDVWLYYNDEPRMQMPMIETSSFSLRVQTEVVSSANDISICYNLYDPKDELVVHQSAQADEFVELRPHRIELWWPLEPKLYRLETVLLQNGKPVQTITQSTAFFEICIRDSQFFINGRPYFLRGQNGLPHCNIPHDREYIRRYVSRICDQGVEITRFHTEPPSHAWLDECDRQGVMVIFEMALHGSMGCYPLGHPQFQKTYLEELRSLITEYRRHPSIVMWCLGNEIIVDSERRLGLGKDAFDVFDTWVSEVRRLDPRPIITNSGGDAAELVQKTVGDVDDIHQYGGWYTETLADLHNYEKYIRKNDFLFSPTICTESIAAYTDNEGKFFVRHGDVRQRKVVRQRWGNPDMITPNDCMTLQAFILKEYTEAMWRMRRDDTTLGGYIPFGQYTWFFDPFDKGPNGLRDKPVWNTYRHVLSPVHVQLECWNRHVVKGQKLSARLLLCHEDRKLPESSDFTIVIVSQYGELYRQNHRVTYHSHFYGEINLDVSNFDSGTHHLSIIATLSGRQVSENDLTIKIYPEITISNDRQIFIYDPARKLESLGTNLTNIHWISDPALMDFDKIHGMFIVGPYGMDRNIDKSSSKLRHWCEKGNCCLVMEQLPCPHSKNMLQTGIGAKRSTQPYWSRWATNMVRHTDRADICNASHPVFTGVTSDDLSWWNGDTFLAHAYLRIDPSAGNYIVLSGVSQGLADDELMPVAHSPEEQAYNPLMVECRCGKGKILFSNLLIGTKLACEPVAKKMLMNLSAM